MLCAQGLFCVEKCRKSLQKCDFFAKNACKNVVKSSKMLAKV